MIGFTRSLKLAFIVVAVLAPAIAQARPLTPARYDEVSVTLPAGASVPKGISILDEEGRPQLLDKWLSVPAVFILADFTCKTLCSPILSMAAASLDKTGLRPGRDFNLVVLGLDPRDGIADARKVRMEQVGAAIAPATLLATANEIEIKRVTEALGYRYAYDADNDQFVHPAAVFVLAAGGAVKRMMTGLGTNPDDLRLALVDASAGNAGTVSDRVRLLCSSFDPAQGIYNVAVSRVLMVVGAMSFLLLGGLISVLSLRGRAKAP